MSDGLRKVRFLVIAHGYINRRGLDYGNPAGFEEHTKIRKVA